MTDRTHEMLERVGAGFFPPAVRSHITRLLNTETVTSYAIQDAHDVATSQGLSIRRRLGILTGTRLIQILWAEAVLDDSEDQDPDDEAATFDRLTRELSGASPEEPTPVLEVSTRTVPISRIVDVDSVTHYSQGSIDPSHMTVVILLPTLNTFALAPIECPDPDCDADHGMRGHAMQDSLTLTADAGDLHSDGIDLLSDFAESVANALAR